MEEGEGEKIMEGFDRSVGFKESKADVARGTNKQKLIGAAKQLTESALFWRGLPVYGVLAGFAFFMLYYVGEKYYVSSTSGVYKGLFAAAAILVIALAVLRHPRAKLVCAAALVFFSALNVHAFVRHPVFFDGRESKMTFTTPATRQVGFNHNEQGHELQYELFILESIRDKKVILRSDSIYQLLGQYAKEYEHRDVRFQPGMRSPDFFRDNMCMLKGICSAYYGARDASYTKCSFWLEGIQEAEAIVIYDIGYKAFYLMPEETYLAMEEASHA